VNVSVRLGSELGSWDLEALRSIIRGIGGEYGGLLTGRTVVVPLGKMVVASGALCVIASTLDASVSH
jgi:hypothetical protein